MIYFLYQRGIIGTTLFIVSDAVPKEILNNLTHYIYLPSYKGKRFSQVRRLLYTFYFKFFRFKREIPGFKDLQLFGQDHLFYSFVFLTKEYKLIEDGLGNYFRPKKSFSYYMRKILLGGDEWGRNSKAKSILLTGLAEIPVELLNKTKILNIRDIWLSLNESQKNKILDSFAIDTCLSHQTITTILLTQPFSEDLVMSEKEKIHLYKSMTLNYSGTLFIKPHPRETTDYSLYFNDNVIVLSKSFPFQLLMLINPPERIVTCFSTVAYLSFSGKVDIFGTAFNEKLFSRYGEVKSNLNDK